MRLGTLSGLLVTVLALAACSGSNDAGGGAAHGKESGPSRGDATTAEEVARQARGKVKCPARISTPPRAEGAPVDDVVGVRPGMTYDEAVNVVLCSHDLLIVEQDDMRAFQIQAFGQKLRHGFNARFAAPPKTSEQIIAEMQDRATARGNNQVIEDMQPGQSKWYVATIGLPGQERVLSAAREEWFAADRYPTLASVQQALIDKYGQPTDAHAEQNYQTMTYRMQWRRDARQQPAAEGRCATGADPDSATNYSPDCGISVAANLRQRADNPDLVEFLQVSVIDKAGGYAAIVATEQGLERLDAERRAAQLQQAEKNSDAPTL